MIPRTCTIVLPAALLTAAVHAGAQVPRFAHQPASIEAACDRTVRGRLMIPGVTQGDIRESCSCLSRAVAGRDPVLADLEDRMLFDADAQTYLDLEPLANVSSGTRVPAPVRAAASDLRDKVVACLSYLGLWTVLDPGIRSNPRQYPWTKDAIFRYTPIEVLPGPARARYYGVGGLVRMALTPAKTVLNDVVALREFRRTYRSRAEATAALNGYVAAVPWPLLQSGLVLSCQYDVGVRNAASHAYWYWYGETPAEHRTVLQGLVADHPLRAVGAPRRFCPENQPS